ncbi:thioredoxin [Parenemella sanctibonifatiensis]|uniref:Thioredoxin n=1 Tax=Parenemella sanctibonifatiensis TaxID=2016505 RepID=A0A255ES76_9ACTN|nr:thioredoxin [Parenemella sanctibonifatiensis]OYN88444.1 thioredoxin [Parenemella sanctibonifatiensis]OYN92445.1 thioredoxin [Parenemella sanctibonifatiensis]
MATVEVTAEKFTETVEANNLVIVDCWAEWCGPCKSFAPVYEEVSEKYDDVVFGKFDIESNREFAAQLDIQAIPTIMGFKDGYMVYKEAGASSAQGLSKLIEGLKGLDMKEVLAANGIDPEAEESATAN